MRIHKSTLKRIISEVIGGSPPVGGPTGGKLIAEFEDGAYVVNNEFVTSGEDHMLDQLQDILDMGVTHVDDVGPSQGAPDGHGMVPIAQWEKIITVQVDHPENRRAFEGQPPPTRWKN